MTPDLAIKSVLLKTINLPEEYKNCFQLYILQKEDIDFVKNQISGNSEDSESHMDTLIRLFVAFFAESLPQQITFNLKNSTFDPKSESSREYLLALAGLLHEAKTILQHQSELFVPYLIAYDEFTKLTGVNNESANDISEHLLLKNFVNNVESAIQAVIRV